MPRNPTIVFHNNYLSLYSVAAAQVSQTPIACRAGKVKQQLMANQYPQTRRHLMQRWEYATKEWTWAAGEMRITLPGQDEKLRRGS